MLSVAGFLSWHALSIQVLNNDFLQNQGDARHLRVVSVPANRGMILDRNGEALAVSTPIASVWADPQSFDFDNQALSQLSTLIDKPLWELKKMVADRKDKEFVYLKRHIDPDLAEKVANLDVPGVQLQREYRRYYPSGEVAGHLLGFTNVDDNGQEGLELAFDEKLNASDGKQRVVKDRLGRIIRAIEMIEPARSGQNVMLSIDRRLQYIAYRELKKAVQQHGAKSGSLVLLDVNSGEVIAQVNQPTFNPNNRSQLLTDNYRNRAVIDVYEPGSTMKPFTIAAALKAKSVSVETVVDTAPGYVRVGDKRISDFRNYGRLDVPTIIQKSSNVGVSQIALRIPKEDMWETFSDFGFGEYPSSQFPGETNGVLPFYGTWQNIQQATLSYGYGLSVSTLQLAQAYAVLANGGIRKPVTYLKVDKLSPASEQDGVRVIDEDIADQLVEMMERVVSREGTGVRASIEGYRVAGKTGTAKKLDETGYTEDKYLSLFAGMAPASNPRLVAVVTIDEPGKGDYYGGKVAAPVFASVMSAALRILNIPPDNVYTEPLQMARVGDDL
ncbi:MAG: penicillin-binding transpeptidase domain-containing protein [Gammaproteobacteria bacterium]|nr:penicillin-binding transpeptidase domain-containing protein [Gammaproteobacteria bacterium]